MRRVGFVLGGATLLAAAGYALTLPRFPPLRGVTSVELAGPRGRLREITQPDTVARLAALAERHYPRWRSVLAPAEGGPLEVTFYRGPEELRRLSFGGAGVLSCHADACVGQPVPVEAVLELSALLRVPRKIVEVPALDSAT